MMGPLLRNLNVLNLCLMAAALSLAFRLSESFNAEPISLPPQAQAAPEEASAIAETEPPTEVAQFSGRNLFWSEQLNPQKTEEKPLEPPPDLVLYGTLVGQDKSYAYLDNLKAPRSTPGRGKRLYVLSSGGAIGGFTLEEIREDGIVLKRGSETITVDVDARDKKGGLQKSPAYASPQPIRPYAPVN